MKNESRELSVVIEVPTEEKWPVAYSAGGLQMYIDLVAKEANEVPDLSTPKGRKRIASLASQVSRCKTAVEGPGRDYLRRLKSAVKPAEDELRRFVQEMDRIRDSIREPLTAWESERKAKEEAQKSIVEQIKGICAIKQGTPSYVIAELRVKLDELFSDRVIEEIRQEVEPYYLNSKTSLEALHHATIVSEQQAAELARLEAEHRAKVEAEEKAKRDEMMRLEGERRARENLIKAELAAKEAEEEARLAKERSEIEAQLAIKKAEEDRIRVENEAKERIRLAEEAREMAERKAKERAELAAKEAARIAEEKHQEEKRKEEARIAAIDAERVAREKDNEHRKKINGEALACLVAGGIDSDTAKRAVVLIARGLVKGVTINY